MEEGKREVASEKKVATVRPWGGGEKDTDKKQNKKQMIIDCKRMKIF